MTGCFADTTILVEISEQRATGAARAVAHGRAYPPASIPEYAHRELLAGRIGLLCDAHNKMLAANNVLEVAIAILGQSSFGRTATSKAIEVLKPLAEMLNGGGGVTAEDAKRQTLEDLMMLANKAWRKATKPDPFNIEQPLACFASGSLTLTSTGALRGPNGQTFSCLSGERCSAAAYLYQNRSELKKMIAALDSPTLSQELKVKRETISRRKALKQLELRGPAAFSKMHCRALGDAYIAGMCPPGSHVLTTNTVDFEPLCASMNKDLKAL